MSHRSLVISIVLMIGGQLHSQVLISLLFGDKLNNENIEFGLEGGVTLSTMSGLDGAEYNNGLNLGLYFDIRLKGPWKLATGAMLKSPWGAKGLAPYATGDTGLDSLFLGGSVERRLNYINIPVMVKREFGQFSLMAGPQIGLKMNANDVFTQEVKNKDDLTYTLDTRSLYRTIDVGAVGAMAFRLRKGHGMNLVVRYYQGLTEIRKDPVGEAQYNSGFHFLVGIPIGAGKAEKARAVKEAGDTE